MTSDSTTMMTTTATTASASTPFLWRLFYVVILMTSSATTRIEAFTIIRNHYGTRHHHNIRQNVMMTTMSSNSFESMKAATTVATDDPMDQYNVVNMEDIINEWTALMTPATALQDEGIYLSPKSKEIYMADTKKFTFRRRRHQHQPLGLHLLEVAGGRDDGIGITIIDDIYDNGCAYNSGMLPGDSIIQIEKRIEKITKNDDDALSFQQEEFIDSISLATECLGYEKTIEAIKQIMNYHQDNDDENNDEEIWIVTCKRLRRRPKVLLKLQYPPQQKELDMTLELFAGENLRRAMLVRGVKLNDPLAKRFDSGGSGDCGAEGSCATCAVSIIRGHELLNPPGRMEQQLFKDRLRYRMACKTIVGYNMQEGDIVIRVNPKQWNDEPSV